MIEQFNQHYIFDYLSLYDPTPWPEEDQARAIFTMPSPPVPTTIA